jgi:hypothetical protein
MMQKTFLTSDLFVWRWKAVSLIVKPMRQEECLYQANEVKNGLSDSGKRSCDGYNGEHRSRHSSDM